MLTTHTQRSRACRASWIPNATETDTPQATPVLTIMLPEDI